MCGLRGVMAGYSRKALNMDSGLATSSVDAVQVEAGVAYLAGKSRLFQSRCLSIGRKGSLSRSFPELNVLIIGAGHTLTA
jgi:hypothetical protein